MKIVIAGAGEVGTHLAKMLSKEKQDIILLDTKVEKLQWIDANYNLMTVVGDPSSFDALKSANAGKADLFIAVTPSDDKNITACMLASKLGAQKTVARIDNYEYMQPDNRAFFKDNLTNEVIYSSSIKNFTTKDSPRIIKCTQIDNAYFANGTVVFNAEVEANIGTSYKSESEKPTDWGVILYRNEQSIESFSIGVGKSTGNVNISFSSEKEYLKTDYTNYTATTSENYSLKAYITYTYDGIDINYVSDESFPVDLVYDQKPSMTIKNLSVGSTVSISEGNWDRKTSYSHDLEVTGAFWMDEVYSYYVGNWTTPGKQGAFIPYDGTISWSGDFGVKFSSEADPHSSYKYFGAIVNGAELKSTNNVVYYFNGGSCSISLSGGTRSAPIGNGINNVNYSAYGSGMIIPNKTVK